MKFLQRIVGGLFVVASLGMISCSSELEVGSPEWCEAEKEQGKMDDYGMKEVMTYAQHCMIKGGSADE